MVIACAVIVIAHKLNIVLNDLIIVLNDLSIITELTLPSWPVRLRNRRIARRRAPLPFPVKIPAPDEDFSRARRMACSMEEAALIMVVGLFFQLAPTWDALLGTP